MFKCDKSDKMQRGFHYFPTENNATPNNCLRILYLSYPSLLTSPWFSSPSIHPLWVEMDWSQAKLSCVHPGHNTTPSQPILLLHYPAFLSVSVFPTEVSIRRPHTGKINREKYFSDCGDNIWYVWAREKRESFTPLPSPTSMYLCFCAFFCCFTFSSLPFMHPKNEYKLVLHWAKVKGRHKAESRRFKTFRWIQRRVSRGFTWMSITRLLQQLWIWIWLIL